MSSLQTITATQPLEKLCLKTKDKHQKRAIIIMGITPNQAPHQSIFPERHEFSSQTDRKMNNFVKKAVITGY